MATNSRDQSRPGSAGIGSTLHLAAEMFNRAAGVEIEHVPYKGAGPALVDLRGGRIDMIFWGGSRSPAASDLRLAARPGRDVDEALRSRARFASHLGDLAGYQVTGWYGLAVPAGTPKELVTELNKQSLRALKSPELIDTLTRQGYVPIGDTPEEASAWLQSETERWTAAIRDAKIQAL